MKKTEKKKHSKKPRKHATTSRAARPIVGKDGRINWSPLLGLAHAAINWTHELATELCRPEEALRVDRVFTNLPAVLHGERLNASTDELLTTLRVIGRGIERDQGMPGGAFDLLASMLRIVFEPLDEPRPAPLRAPMAVPMPAPIMGIGGGCVGACAAPSPMPSLGVPVFGALIDLITGRAFASDHHSRR